MVKKETNAFLRQIQKKEKLSIENSDELKKLGPDYSEALKHKFIEIFPNIILIRMNLDGHMSAPYLIVIKIREREPAMGYLIRGMTQYCNWFMPQKILEGYV